MSRRFSDSNKEIKKAVQASHPKSENYLKFDSLKPLLTWYASKLQSEDGIMLELLHAEKVIRQANSRVKSNCEAIEVLTRLRAAFLGLLQLLCPNNGHIYCTM